MGSKNNNHKKRTAIMVFAPLFLAIAGVGLTMSGLRDNSMLVTILAIIILLFDVILIVYFFLKRKQGQIYKQE